MIYWIMNHLGCYEKKLMKSMCKNKGRREKQDALFFFKAHKL